VFTNFLGTQSESFKETVGTGKQVQWKIGQGGKGNEGVAAAVQGTAGAIGYMELNYAAANHIPFGAVKNKAGKFVKADADSVSSAGESVVADLKGDVLAANLWNQPGEGAYPIASFTYLIFYKDLSTAKTAQEAQTLIQFARWCAEDGQAFAKDMHYAPLSAGVKAKVLDAIKSLSYSGGK
jgi:phosphate transport system substrate-binding protein